MNSKYNNNDSISIKKTTAAYASRNQHKKIRKKKKEAKKLDIVEIEIPKRHKQMDEKINQSVINQNMKINSKKKFEKNPTNNIDKKNKMKKQKHKEKRKNKDKNKNKKVQFVVEKSLKESLKIDKIQQQQQQQPIDRKASNKKNNNKIIKKQTNFNVNNNKRKSNNNNNNNNHNKKKRILGKYDKTQDACEVEKMSEQVDEEKKAILFHVFQNVVTTAAVA